MRLKPVSIALTALAATLSTVAATSSASAQEPLGRAMLVLDASGSM